MKIWIFLRKKKKLTQVDRTSKKFVWNYPYTPEGMVQYFLSPKAWEYVEWGETRAECLVKVNKFKTDQIADLKRRIAELEAELVKDADV